MLRLSQLLHSPVLSAEGQRLGRVGDLVVAGSAPAHVRGIQLRRRGGDVVVRWEHVASADRAGVTLRPEPVLVDLDREAEIDAHLHHDELLLARDVLDTQVIDTAGLRVARVADVLLSRTEDGSLDVVAVDISGAAVLRRLGLSALTRRWPGRIIEWSDLLLTSDRAHDVQLASPSAVVHRLDSATIARLLASLPATDAADLLLAVGPTRSAHVIGVAEADVSTRVLAALERGDIEPVLAAMPASSAGRLRLLLRRETAWSRRRFTRWGLWRARHRP